MGLFDQTKKLKKGGDLYEGDNWFAQHIEQKGVAKNKGRGREWPWEENVHTRTYTHTYNFVL